MNKMKINYLFFVSIILLSCANNDTKKKMENTSSNPIIIEKQDTVCKDFERFYKSIDFETKKVDFPISAIKCKLNSKINTKKYQSAILNDYFKSADKLCMLYKVDCSAGGDCGEYYLAILDQNLSLLDNKLIAKDYSQGEQNEFLKSYDINEGLVSLIIVEESYDEEKEDYVEKKKNIVYSITETGKITLKKD